MFARIVVVALSSLLVMEGGTVFLLERSLNLGQSDFVFGSSILVVEALLALFLPLLIGFLDKGPAQTLPFGILFDRLLRTGLMFSLPLNFSIFDLGRREGTSIPAFLARLAAVGANAFFFDRTPAAWASLNTVGPIARSGPDLHGVVTWESRIRAKRGGIIFAGSLVSPPLGVSARV